MIAGFDTALTFTEGNAALLLDTDVTVTDADSANFDTGTLTVYLNVAAELADQLAIRHEGTATGQIDRRNHSVLLMAVRSRQLTMN